jgi:periplasmic protein TonB
LYPLPPGFPEIRNKNMIAQMLKKPDPHFRWLKTGYIWTGSIIIAILFNILLFSLMPRLIQSNHNQPQQYEKIQMVNFIRIKPREIPPKPREQKKEPEKQTPEKQNIVITATRPPKPSFKKLDLPFELNPRLPVGAIQLPAPDIKSIAMEGPNLKDYFDVGEIDSPLTPVVQMHPIYPVMAKRQGIEGWVKVRFLVTETGRVEKVSILDADPQKIFDHAVIQCVNAWRFKPGTVEGIPVNVWAETIVRFELE